MENEIKVGEYVRTIDGYIGKKVKDGLRSGTIEIEDNICSWITDIRFVVKHSPNLIDLIEEGDYVNGHKVVNEIWGEDDNNLYFEIEGGYNKARYIGEDEIEEVVTKEMMEFITYKVKQEEN